MSSFFAFSQPAPQAKPATQQSPEEQEQLDALIETRLWHIVLDYSLQNVALNFIAFAVIIIAIYTHGHWGEQFTALALTFGAVTLVRLAFLVRDGQAADRQRQSPPAHSAARTAPPETGETTINHIAALQKQSGQRIRYSLGVVSTASLWALMLHFTLQTGDPTLTLVAVVITAALGAGATGTLSASRLGGLIYVTLFLLQATAQLIIAPQVPLSLGLMGIVFALSMSVTHRRNHHFLRSALCHQFENDRLIENLTIQKETLTTFNHHLEERVRRRTHDLQYQAEHDDLTTLLNRRGLLQWVESRPSALPKDHRYLVVFIALDRFKQINDGLGHAFGDFTLAEIGKRLFDIPMEQGTFCRWGSDEFVGLIAVHQDTAREFGEAFTERLRDIVEQPITAQNREVSIRFSAGLALANPNPIAVSEAVHAADLVAGEIKRQGRGQIRFCSENMMDEKERQLIITQRLKNAVRAQELSLAFQPVVNAHDFSVQSYEVLLRWDNPILGRVSPAEFIPIAEDTGDILEIGNFVLSQGLKQFTQHFGTGSDMRLAVNISPRQLVEPGFAALVLEHLSVNRMCPSQLIVEVTETLFADDGNVDFLQALHQLRDNGIAVHIDDFGTGYSSLSRLHDLPVSALKIDRSFVRTLDERRIAIIEGSRLIAREFALETVAEGVESIEQALTLRDMGIDFLQGFLFGKPDAKFQPVAVEIDFIDSKQRQSVAPSATVQDKVSAG